MIHLVTDRLLKQRRREEQEHQAAKQRQVQQEQQRRRRFLQQQQQQVAAGSAASQRRTVVRVTRAASSAASTMADSGYAATITKDAGYTINLNVLKTAVKEEQPVLAKGLEHLNQMLVKQPGFVSAVMHESLDGSMFFNYVQWANQEAFVTASQVPDIAQAASLLLKNNLVPDPPVWDLKSAFTVHATRGDQPTSITASHNSIVVLVMFQVDSSSQIDELLIDIGKFIDTVASSPGFVSANFHVSNDRTRAFNYAQWESKEAYVTANQRPDYAAGLQNILKYRPLVGGPASVYQVHQLLLQQ
eukprot:jgi/Chlat1/7460/Chrsp6S07464